jgi:virginiamycin B lyase
VLDPKTGKVVEYPLPITKPGAPVGSLDLVFSHQGNIWMGTMYQGTSPSSTGMIGSRR